MLWRVLPLSQKLASGSFNQFFLFNSRFFICMRAKLDTTGIAGRGAKVNHTTENFANVFGLSPYRCAIQFLDKFLSHIHLSLCIVNKMTTLYFCLPYKTSYKKIFDHNFFLDTFTTVISCIVVIMYHYIIFAPFYANGSNQLLTYHTELMSC